MKNSLFIGICIAAGLTVLGICINKGLQSFSNKERIVTVKGLAEKEFKAESATVGITVRFTGDLAKEIAAKTEKRTVEIVDYLKSVGYESVSISDIDIYDHKTYYEKEWEGNKLVAVKRDRFQASKQICFDVKKVEEASAIKSKINIDLINSDFSQSVASIDIDYHFADLNSIKPELIAESTKNARLSGEQFAKDSKSKLGKIKTATQSQINLDYTDYIQKTRVISTIIFFLED